MNRRTLLHTLAAGAIGVTVATALPGRAAADPPFPLGMNLAGIADWSAEIVFVDAFRTSRPWSSQKDEPGAAYGSGGPLDLDDRGWPKKLAPKQFAESLMYVDIGNHYPGGKYVCLFDGTGELEFSNAGQGKQVGPNRYDVDVDPGRGFVALRVRKTDPKNPVRNIRFVMAKYLDTYQKEPYLPEFVNRYKGFQVIRFMDFQKTNNSKEEKWSDRPRVDDATFGGVKGVPVELCVQLANSLNADAWLCLPHKADDDYVRNFAKVVKDKLDPKHKVYVEYSNETWNTIFEQSKYCQEKGLGMKLSTNPYEAQIRYSAQRSVEIFKIFEEVFGGTDRLVRVLAAHGAHTWTGTTAMDWQDAYKSADAIAIAPYFGNKFGDPKTADKVAAMSVDELLDELKTLIADNRKTNETYAAEAKKRNLKLMTYESGQHLVGYNGAQDNEKLTKLFHEANRHPRMKELYLEDLKNWQEIGGSTYCVFSSLGRYTKWGSWGVLEYHDQDPATAPKYQAIRQFMTQGK
jgi:hypothetical protein